MYSAPSPAIPNESLKDKITNDLRKAYNEILEKHLDGRTIKEDKINSWMNNILIEAKDYFIKKYPDYSIFLYNTVYPRNIYFRSNATSISIPNTDWVDCISFTTDNLYSILYFFFYKNTNLDYNVEEKENEIIQKGNNLLQKHLDDRKYNYDKIASYNENINKEHIEFILKTEKSVRCFCLNEIYQIPIQSKYYFKYISYGKEISSKIFQTYINDSLIAYHSLFFFK
jgi:hypothetical protein